MNINKTPMWEGQPTIHTERNRVLLSLFPETVEVEAYDADNSVPMDAHTETIAWQVWVSKPLTRAAAINACEQEAYGLKTAMEVASFGASLARKARLGQTPDEVTAHDEFIENVKKELTRIGVV